MNTDKHRWVILNRAAPISNDGWIHIVPKGELPNAAAGIVQVLDETAHDSMLAGIAADKQRLGDNWPGIYAGEEHFIYDDSKSSAAFGWFKDFEKRDDGIWAKADGLTDIGAVAIKNKRFKFTSFVADPADTQKLDGKRVRILKLETVGFTNAANGKELLTPITNRGDSLKAELQTKFRRGDESAADNNNQRKKMKTVCSLVGLSADASEESVHAAVSKLLNRATEAETKLTPLQTQVTELTTANATLLQEQIAADFAVAGIKDEKFVNRHAPLLSDAKHFKNRGDRLAFIADVAQPAGGATQQQNKLQNRNTTPPNGKKADDDANGQPDAATATKIMNRASLLRKDLPGLSLATSVGMAKKEIETES